MSRRSPSGSVRHGSYRSIPADDAGAQPAPKTSTKQRSATVARSPERLAKQFHRDIRELSLELAPWKTPDMRRVRQLETRIDRKVTAWEAALGENPPVRERQPLP